MLKMSTGRVEDVRTEIMDLGVVVFVVMVLIHGSKEGLLLGMWRPEGTVPVPIYKLP